MADHPNPTDAPSTSRIFSAASEEPENIKFEREEKIRQLQWELEDLRERMNEMERKQSQPVYPYPMIRVESAPPGFSMQTPMLVPWGTVPPQWQPPGYYPDQNQIPWTQQPLTEAKERCTTKKERRIEKMNSQKQPLNLTIPKKKKTSKKKKTCKNSRKGRWTQSGSGFGQRSAWCNTCRAYHLGSCSELTRRCLRCGIVGHEVQHCLFKSDVCWNCQKEGHRSGQCMSVKSYGSRQGARGESVGDVAGPSAAASGRKRKNPFLPEGCAFLTSVDTTTATDDIITGMFLINSVLTRMLFDTGANRSFMSVAYCAK